MGWDGRCVWFWIVMRERWSKSTFSQISMKNIKTAAALLYWFARFTFGSQKIIMTMMMMKRRSENKEKRCYLSAKSKHLFVIYRCLHSDGIGMEYLCNNVSMNDFIILTWAELLHKVHNNPNSKDVETRDGFPPPCLHYAHLLSLSENDKKKDWKLESLSLNVVTKSV